MAGVVHRDSIQSGFIDHKQLGVLFGTGLCAAGLLSLLYLKFVSWGKTLLKGEVPAGLTRECLCHP